MTMCPCGSGRLFDTCCGPVIANRSAQSAEALMRSRYCAFVRGDLEYLQRTSSGKARLNFDAENLRQAISGTIWDGLQILEKSGGGEGDEKGTVRFRVRFRQSGRTFVQTELSEFRRIEGRWYYCDGKPELERANVGAASSTGRNDPCPCGSGLKYKKCCGR